jgi:hypothetical protein
MGGLGRYISGERRWKKMVVANYLRDRAGRRKLFYRCVIVDVSFVVIAVTLEMNVSVPTKPGMKSGPE